MSMSPTPDPLTGDWPPLPFPDWQDTQETLHRWLQIAGKVKLELTPFLNEWWNVALTVTARGLSTGPIPYGAGTFEIAFDFIDHTLFIHTSAGQTRALPLLPRSVAAFYAEFFEILRSLGIEVSINPMPVEIVNPISCAIDHERDAYDADAVHRWWRILLGTERVLQHFRTPFVGKSSPILWFWGSFDLTHVRFSGRPAEPPPGAPRFVQLAEDQENYACGFWPGNANYSGVLLNEPAFYAYIYPEPPDFPTAPVLPAAAAYRPELGQFILPYAAVRESAAPEQAIHDFFSSTYEAAATAAAWDRSLLERHDLPGLPGDRRTPLAARGETDR
jgi:hypothetical protein